MMQIYFSSAREDLEIVRQLAGLLTQDVAQATGESEIIVHPFDDPAAVGMPEPLPERAEQQMAESGFVVLLLSPAALRDPGVARDLDQVRRLRAAEAVKLFVVVVVRPVPPISLLDLPLDGLPTIHAVARPPEEVARELAEYATWRPRQTGGRIVFAPPPPPAEDEPPPVQSVEPPEETAAPPPAGWIRLGGPPKPATPPAQSSAPPPPPAEEERARGITLPPPPPAQSAAPPPPPQPRPIAPPPPVEAPGSPPSPPQPAPFAPGSAPPPPAGRVTGAPMPRRRATEQAPSTLTEQALQFSAYHPNTVAVETWQTLLVYTYLGEALAQIQADAATFTELGSAPTVALGQASRAVARGVELIIEPHMEGVTFSPKRESFVWRGDWRRSLFRFSGAATLAGQTPRGWIDIYAAPLVPIARIDLALPFHGAGAQQLAAHPPRGMIVTSNIHDAVFISYSHHDSEAFRQACAEYRRFHINIYTDELLEAGAQYERELGRMIAQANVFHLLWSPHTAVSTECRKEWLAALAREPSERFIKPWYWKRPLANLPEELVQHRISFKYEPLKRNLWRPQTWF